MSVNDFQAYLVYISKKMEENSRNVYYAKTDWECNASSVEVYSDLHYL